MGIGAVLLCVEACEVGPVSTAGFCVALIGADLVHSGISSTACGTNRGGMVIRGAIGTVSFLGAFDAVEEEADLCQLLDSLSLPAEVPIRTVAEVPGASNVVTPLTIGTKGSDHATEHFLFSGSPWVGDASLFLNFLEKRELALSSEEAPEESTIGFFQGRWWC